MHTDPRYPQLDPVAVALDLAVAQLQRAEFARAHPDVCSDCQGRGTVPVTSIRTDGVVATREACHCAGAA